MSDQLTAESLALLMHRWRHGSNSSTVPCPNCLNEARYILASPKFVAHNEAIRREQVRLDGESLSSREAIRSELIKQGLGAFAELDRLKARIAALHFEVKGGWCDHCWTGPDAHGNGPSPEWPCATMRVLGGSE